MYPWSFNSNCTSLIHSGYLIQVSFLINPFIPQPPFTETSDGKISFAHLLYDQKWERGRCPLLSIRNWMWTDSDPQKKPPLLTRFPDLRPNRLGKISNVRNIGETRNPHTETRSEDLCVFWDIQLDRIGEEIAGRRWRQNRLVCAVQNNKNINENVEMLPFYLQSRNHSQQQTD